MNWTILQRSRRVPGAIALAGALALLSGCYDYGYGGVSAGYGAGGYYDDGFGGPGYAGYGGYGGYGAVGGYGWYDNFYYPGTGIYVFDRGGGRHRWNDRQRQYWASRGNGGRGIGGRGGDGRNWTGGRPGGNDGIGVAGRPDGRGRGRGRIDGVAGRPDRGQSRGDQGAGRPDQAAGVNGAQAARPDFGGFRNRGDGGGAGRGPQGFRERGFGGGGDGARGGGRGRRR